MQRLAEIEVSAEELAAARAGDRDARRALFERVAPATLAIIRRLVAQRALAEDLLQDTLIAMFEHLGDFRGEAPFGIWVRSIAVSRCLMAFRSPWHRARVALESWTEDSSASGESTSRTSDLIDLDRALAKLSPVTRAVVWMYDVEGWSHDEIARAFERTVSFSKSQLARGHARLRIELQAPMSAALVIPLRSDFDGQ
jgi:RNA polymerase sigma-70 factor (ECF subfamily)